MGCCFSSPILSDTTIQGHVKVARFAVIRKYSSYRNESPGMLYTNGTMLYYDAVTSEGKRICCSGIVSFRVPVSKLNTIMVTEDVKVVELPGERKDGPWSLMRGPVIEIKTDNDQVIIASTPDGVGSFPSIIEGMINNKVPVPR